MSYAVDAKRQSSLKRILRVGYSKFVKSVPRNRSGDKLLSLISFVIQHRRLPSDKLIFNDYLYRIKTSDELLDPLRVFVSDKEFLKLYVKATVGDQYNVPTIAVLSTSREVQSFSFPMKCCIKPTHTSGRLILRRNGEPIDRSEIEKWFDINYYLIGRETNYRTLKPKVIIEPLIFDKVDNNDFKFHCFYGKVRLIQVDTNRQSNHRRNFFDTKWNELDFSIQYPKSTSHIPQPGNLCEMIHLAEILSSKFSFVRVDLYSNGTNIYVGELTNCHGNASEVFIPASSELVASEMLFGSDS